MKRLTSILGTAAIALTLTACGSGSPSGTQSATQDEAAAESGLSQVTVGAIPIGDVAPIHLGKAKGFFEAEGIDLTIEPTTGGAVSLPGVVSGDFDFAFVNIVSLMVAQDQGLKVQYVSNGTTARTVEDDNVGLIVGGDAQIESLEDLEGKTVSSNQLANIGDTAVRAAVDGAGGDSSTISFVEVAFPDALPAIENGQIDAAVVPEPFMSMAVENGAKVLAFPYAETHPDLDTGGYFTMKQTIEEKPELVAGFRAAMNRSLEYAQENSDEVRDIIETYTEIDPALIQEITLPEFKVEFNREAAQTIGDAALEHGTIDDAPDLDALLPAEGN